MGPILSKQKIKILGVCGSLRQGSSNRELLLAYQQLMPADKVEMQIYSRLGDIPIFNPDLSAGVGSAVQDFREELRGADGVIIASPEYLHGITGVLKNALDWIAESGELSRKRVAVPNASKRATLAHAALLEVLRTMEAVVVVEACQCIPLSSNQITAQEILAQKEWVALIEESIDEFLKKV